MNRSLKSAVAILLVLILAAATFVAEARIIGSGDFRGVDKKLEFHTALSC